MARLQRLSAALLLAASLPQHALGQTPKHVLMIVVDDLGFTDVGYKQAMYNMTGGVFSTPTIDALAMSGVRLESYYTHFLCSPSRTAMLSGRYAYTGGGNDEVIVDGQPDQLPTNIRTIADMLKLAPTPWATFAGGKWDAGMTSWGCTPNCRGFDRWAGYYGADEDYLQHETGGALDLRLDWEADRSQTGVYSTHLITRRASDWITEVVNTRGTDAPSFAYVAYQAIHAPQQVPPEYIAGPCEAAIPANEPIRLIACGQMKTVDEAVANLTSLYKSLGIWQDTLVILTTDNGGNTDTGGGNWPLRGIKATLFEGGVRGTSFVSGAGLSPSVRGTVSTELFSIVDWLPTIVHGIAGVDLAQAMAPKYPYQSPPPALDGMDVWQSISTGTPSPRTEVLLSLQPTTCWGDPTRCVIPGAGAIRIGQWKLIYGHTAVWASTTSNVTASFCGPRDGLVQHGTIPLNVTAATTPPFCPTGWVPPPGSGLEVVPPPDEPGCHTGPGGAPVVPCMLPPTSPYLSGGTWLFDVVSDPTEQNNQASARPDIVQQLLARLQQWNATNIPQQHSPMDPASDPANFGGVWTPWRGDPVPQHCDPNTTAPLVRSNLDGVTFTKVARAGEAAGAGDDTTAAAAAGVGAAPDHYAIQVSGWAWDAGAPDGGHAQMNVSVVVDGAPLGWCIAGVDRPGLVPKTGAPDPYHGFLFNASWPATANITSGKHTWHVYATGAWYNGRLFELNKSPQCYCDMVQCAC